MHQKTPPIDSSKVFMVERLKHIEKKGKNIEKRELGRLNLKSAPSLMKGLETLIIGLK